MKNNVPESLLDAVVKFCNEKSLNLCQSQLAELQSEASRSQLPQQPN